MASLDEINKAIEDNRPKIYKKDYTFFNIGFMYTLAKASHKESCDCADCRANMDSLMAMAVGYPELISSGEQGKRKLEDGMDGIAHHLIKEHGYARDGWYKPLYSLVGIGVGLVIALICVYVLFPGTGYERVAFWLSVLVPAVAGYIAGASKDFKYVKAGKKL